MMQINDFFGKCQPDTRALIIRVFGILSLREAFKNLGQLILGDSDPVIFHSQETVFPIFCQSGNYMDAATGRGKLEGIGYDVPNNNTQLLLIRPYHNSRIR